MKYYCKKRRGAVASDDKFRDYCVRDDRAWRAGLVDVADVRISFGGCGR